MRGADTSGLIDCDLLMDADVQVEVEKRIGLTRVGEIFLIDTGIRLFQDSVIFGMKGDDISRNFFERGQWLPSA